MPLPPPQRWGTGNSWRRIRLSEAFIKQTFGGAADSVITDMEFPTAAAQNLSGTVTGVAPATTGTAAGRKGGRGVATGVAPATSGTAAGRKATTGTAVGVAPATSGTATGTKKTAGTVVGTATASGTVVGSEGSNGTVTGSASASGTATGTKATTGTATGTATASGTVAGTAARLGVVTGSATATGTVTGTKFPPDAPVTPTATGGMSPYRRAQIAAAQQLAQQPEPPAEHHAGSVHGSLTATCTITGRATRTGRCQFTTITTRAVVHGTRRHPVQERRRRDEDELLLLI